MTAVAAEQNLNGELYAVVPAAGSGSRMNLAMPKQFVEIAGQSVLLRSVNRLLQVDSLQQVVLATDPAMESKLAKLPFSNPDKVKICTGGASRAESVLNGLALLLNTVSSKARVLVHDAARPCVRVADIQRLIDTADDEHGGLLAMPVTDTIKRADQNLRCEETVDRDRLWRAATPQLFNAKRLHQALEYALQQGLPVTDEASAMQLQGYSPILVECQSDNIKITTAPDLALAEHYLSVQKNEAG